MMDGSGGIGGGGMNLHIAWDLSLSENVVKENNYFETVDFLMKCKNGDPGEVAKFLEESLRFLKTKYQVTDSVVLPMANMSFVNGNAQQMIASNNDDTKLIASNNNDSSTSFKERPFGDFVGDEIDEKRSTLVMLVPGDIYVIGHLIGKAGSGVGTIEKETNVAIRVEGKDQMPVGSLDRRVFVIGTVTAVTAAQQVITERINEKLKTEGIQQDAIKMVIPEESVRHIIGKAGSVIKRIQDRSGARLQVGPERAMVPGCVGRPVSITGTRYERSMAQYLVTRQLAENGFTRKEWQGGNPQPIPHVDRDVSFRNPAPISNSTYNMKPVARGQTGILSGSISKPPEGSWTPTTRNLFSLPPPNQTPFQRDPSNFNFN